MNLNMRARHAFVAVVIVVLGGLTAFGCVGPAVGVERIHSFDITALIREDRTVAIREVIDYDFGPESRRGIVRLIPNLGGTPQDITVSSPTAPDQFTTRQIGNDTEIRIGDPDQTNTGRHRYVVEYVLPDTIRSDAFDLDAIGATSEVPLTHGRVTVLGATLSNARCFVGQPQSQETCDIEERDGGYHVAEDDLSDHAGISIEADVAATRAATFPELPPFEGRDQGARLTWTVVVVALGAITALVVFVLSRQMGRNEVAGGGATEAAFVDFGTETFGTVHQAPAQAPAPVAGARMVADTKMGELAGLEFVPPGGIEPWQASVVARETIDDRTVGAWFASLAAHDIVEIDKDGDDVTLRAGAKANTADATVAPILNRAMSGRTEIALGSYSPAFSAAWQEAGAAIDGWSVGSQTFRRRPPRFGAGAKGCIGNVGAVVPLVVVGGIFTASVGGTFSRTAIAAVVLAIAVPGLAAFVAYRRLTRSLSARGSAIALRTESFRRFLHDSEAQHVEWAWENGLLREYSAWAVALGEVDAWNGAMAASQVPPAEVHASHGIMAPVIYSSAFSSTTTAPSTSGSSGGGGGFSGGSVGGGGGGGSTGSW